MASIPLRLGPLAAEGFTIQRSGIRWLCDDGHPCKRGEVVGYCNLALIQADRTKPRSGVPPFAGELRDLQVAFAVARDGTLRHSPHSSRGGFFDWQPDFLVWNPEFSIGTLETADRRDTQSDLRLLFLAGRRATEFAEAHSGLLTGWHERTRAWWGAGLGRPGTLLSTGICEQLGIIRGESQAFLEMFEAAQGPAHIVYNPDDALVPCARVLAEQLLRTPAENDAIAADFAGSFGATGAVPIGRGWIFGGTLLSALQRSPLSDRYDILSRTGLSRIGPPDAVLLSLHAESPQIMRHKKLGYSINCYQYRLQEVGPAVRTWLQTNFEPVNRTLDDIAKDYRDLAAAIRARSSMKMLILNAMSSSGMEDVQNYMPFDRPMGNTLASIHNKEMNLMLHDLAVELDLAVVDVDAIGAELGGGTHLPDGLHSSGRLQAELRSEIIRTLRGLGVPGFIPR